MRVRITHARTLKSGNRVTREERLECESLRIGRGTDNPLQLGGLSVDLHHATIAIRQDRTFLLAVARHDLTLNGSSLDADHPLRPGDAIRIGEHELRILAAGPDEDVALEVEHVELRGGERQAQEKRTRIGSPSRRPLAWAMAGVVPALFLALPLQRGAFRSSWETGPVSPAHESFGADCERCHAVGFESVGDEACLACHAEVGRHAKGDFHVSEFAEARCTGCHAEHRERGRLAALEQRVCTDCHADLGERLPGSELENVEDFSSHPEFVLSVLVPASVEAGASGAKQERPAVARVRWDRELRERSGLKFDHFGHVGKVVIGKDGKEKRNLRCGECHVPDDAGMAMQPVRFEKHCATCHTLPFDEDHPKEQARHGDLDEMREGLRRFYRSLALEGAVKDPRAPRFLRQRPGRPLTEAERRAALEWADGEAARATHALRKACSDCHTVIGSDGRPVEASNGRAASSAAADPEPVRLAPSDARITGVRVGEHGSYTRVVVETDAPAPYAITRSEREIVVRVGARSRPQTLGGVGPWLESVRVAGGAEEGTVRLGVRNASLEVQAKRLEGPPRIVLDLRAGGPPPAPPRAGASGDYAIAPVAVTELWLPRGEFRHATHATSACHVCHPAAAAYQPPEAPGFERPAWSEPGSTGPFVLLDVAGLAELGLEPSQTSEDVLVPGVAACKECHGGAAPGPARVSSECLLCHPFHREPYGPMVRLPEQ